MGSDKPLSHSELTSWFELVVPLSEGRVTRNYLESLLPPIIAQSIQESSKWYRVVNAINEKLKGDFQMSFKLCESFLSRVQEVNPDAIIKYETTVDGEGFTRFGRCAIMFKCQSNILKASKPIISLDGGHLKHPLWGGYQILICCGQDGNDRDTILGIAIVPTESDEQYSFLLDAMMEDEEMKRFLLQPQLIITSDRAKGLLKTIETKFPQAHHRFCALHLLGNIPKPAFTEEIAILYWEIVTAETEEKFKSKMLDMKKVHPGAYDYLSQIDPKYWSNWAIPNSAFGHLTNNLSERGIKFMGCDLDSDRRLPIKELIFVYIKKVIYNYFYIIIRWTKIQIISCYVCYMNIVK